MLLEALRVEPELVELLEVLPAVLELDLADEALLPERLELDEEELRFTVDWLPEGVTVRMLVFDDPEVFTLLLTVVLPVTRLALLELEEALREGVAELVEAAALRLVVVLEALRAASAADAVVLEALRLAVVPETVVLLALREGSLALVEAALRLVVVLAALRLLTVVELAERVAVLAALFDFAAARVDETEVVCVASCAARMSRAFVIT